MCFLICLKFVAIIFLRTALRLLYLYPIKQNRVLLEASEGEIFGCNPKYIFIFLYEKYGNGIDYVWCLNDKKKMPKEYHVKCVSYLSFKHVFYLMTSKVIITNVGIEPFFPKRKSQLVINTWHGGGAYKDGGKSSRFLSKSRVKLLLYMLKLRAEMTNYLVSSCQVWNPIYSMKFFIPEERILNTGLPRNDLFFKKGCHELLRYKICQQYGIKGQSTLVLYAPTFRGYWRHTKNTSWEFDVEKVRHAVEQRFGGKCTILFRHHLLDKSRHLEHVLDVSDYQDMQELLAVADVLITDYSSSIWDYSLTYKPGFLYTPDLNSYENETSFLTPIDVWPYPNAQTIDDLCSLINSYEEHQSIIKIQRHHEQFCCFEDGHATEKVCRAIEDWCCR